MTCSPVNGDIGGRQVGVLLRQIVSLRHGVDRGPDHGVVNGFGDQFAKQVNLQVAPSQALDVVDAGDDRFVFTILFMFYLQHGNLTKLHIDYGTNPCYSYKKTKAKKRLERCLRDGCFGEIVIKVGCFQ